MKIFLFSNILFFGLRSSHDACSLLTTESTFSVFEHFRCAFSRPRQRFVHRQLYLYTQTSMTFHLTLSYCSISCAAPKCCALETFFSFSSLLSLFCNSISVQIVSLSMVHLIICSAQTRVMQKKSKLWQNASCKYYAVSVSSYRTRENWCVQLNCCDSFPLSFLFCPFVPVRVRACVCVDIFCVCFFFNQMFFYRYASTFLVHIW